MTSNYDPWTWISKGTEVLLPQNVCQQLEKSVQYFLSYRVHTITAGGGVTGGGVTGGDDMKP